MKWELWSSVGTKCGWWYGSAIARGAPGVHHPRDPGALAVLALAQRLTHQHRQRVVGGAARAAAVVVVALDGETLRRHGDPALGVGGGGSGGGNDNELLGAEPLAVEPEQRARRRHHLCGNAHDCGVQRGQLQLLSEQLLQLGAQLLGPRALRAHLGEEGLVEIVEHAERHLRPHRLEERLVGRRERDARHVGRHHVVGAAGAADERLLVDHLEHAQHLAAAIKEGDAKHGARAEAARLVEAAVELGIIVGVGDADGGAADDGAADQPVVH